MPHSRLTLDSFHVRTIIAESALSERYHDELSSDEETTSIGSNIGNKIPIVVSCPFLFCSPPSRVRVITASLLRVVIVTGLTTVRLYCCKSLTVRAFRFPLRVERNKKRTKGSTRRGKLTARLTRSIRRKSSFVDYSRWTRVVTR